MLNPRRSLDYIFNYFFPPKKFDSDRLDSSNPITFSRHFSGPIHAGLPHGELSRRITLVRRKKVIRRYQYSSPDIANYCESDIN